MNWLVRLRSIENRMDNQAKNWVQGEEECAKKMSFGSLLSCSSWLYLEVIRVGELLSLGPCGLAAPHSGAFTSQFASLSSPPTPHKSLFKTHLASPYYCRLPFNFTIFCKVQCNNMMIKSS